MNSYKPSVTVVYIARGIDWGVDTVEQFIDSYKKYSAGYEHNLIIAAKAWDTKPDEYERLKNLASEISATIIDLPDDGFDFGAYYRVAVNLDSNYIMCLVTSSEIMCENWLKKLIQPEYPYIGISGLWMGGFGTRFRYEKEKLKQESVKKDFKYRLKNLLIHFYTISDLFHYKKYPTGMLRTGAFLIDRLLYLKLINKYKFPKTKYDAYCIERNLSIDIKRKNKICVVGRDGKIYFEEDFDKSGTYLSDFQNYIIKDKQIRLYEQSDEIEKRKSEYIVWRNINE